MKEADLWCRFLELAQFEGASGFDDNTPHFHIGVTLVNPNNPEYSKELNIEAVNRLNQMVNYLTSFKDKRAADKCAWINLNNFEEIRLMADNSFVFTTTYLGTCGRRGEHLPYLGQEKLKRVVETL